MAYHYVSPLLNVITAALVVVRLADGTVVWIGGAVRDPDSTVDVDPNRDLAPLFPGDDRAMFDLPREGMNVTARLRGVVGAIGWQEGFPGEDVFRQAPVADIPAPRPALPPGANDA